MAHHKLAMWKWGSTSLLVPRTVSHLWKPSTTRSITPCTGRMMLPRCWLLSGLVDLFKIALLESTIFLRIILRIIECLCVATQKERKSKSRERTVVYIVFCPCSPELYMLFRKHLLWLRISIFSICSDPALSSEVWGEVGSSLNWLTGRV